VPWQAYKEQDRYTETFGVGTSRISELRHRWLRSGGHHTAKSRRLFSNFVTTTPWRIARRVCQSQAIGTCDEVPWPRGESCLRPSISCLTKQDLGRRTSGVSICGFKRRCIGDHCGYRRSPRTASAQNPECQKRQATSQKGRAIDPLRHLRGVVPEKPSDSASPGCPRARKTRISAQDIGSDASRYHRQPRHPLLPFEPCVFSLIYGAVTSYKFRGTNIQSSELAARIS